MKKAPDQVLAWLARIARVLTAPFVRYEIRGGRCVSNVHVGVVACNHRSLFDVVAGLVGLHHFRRYPRLLIGREYVEGRWTGPFARAIGAIPVDRTSSGGTSFESAVAALRSGVPVLVMPEGRLHWDPERPGELGPARSGVSRLAVAAEVVVMAAGLSGTERVWPASSRLPRLNPLRRKRVVINVADEPLVFHGEDHQANTDRVMEAIRSLLVS